MSAPTQGGSSPSPSTPTSIQAPPQTGPSGGATPMPATGATSGGGSDAGISSLSSLKEQSPAFYKLLMVSIAQTICSQSQKSQDKIKQMLKESQQNQ